MKSGYLKALEDLRKTKGAQTFFKAEAVRTAEREVEKLDAVRAAEREVEKIRARAFELGPRAWCTADLGYLHDAYGNPRRRECRCPTCARGQAVRALWRPVVDDLVVRHPDPGCTVELGLEYEPGDPYVRIFFRFRGLLDTDDPERKRTCMPGFHMLLLASTWPGRQAAEVAVLGAWLSYMRHECMELVTKKSVADCVLVFESWDGRLRPRWHPHACTELGRDVKDAIDKCFHSHGTTADLIRVAEEAVGDRAAGALFEVSAPRALEEFLAELDVTSGTVAVDQ